MKAQFVESVPLIEWLDYLKQNNLRAVKYTWHNDELCALVEEKKKCTRALTAKNH